MLDGCRHVQQEQKTQEEVWSEFLMKMTQGGGCSCWELLKRRRRFLRVAEKLVAWQKSLRFWGESRCRRFSRDPWLFERETVDFGRENRRYSREPSLFGFQQRAVAFWVECLLDSRLFGWEVMLWEMTLLLDSNFWLRDDAGFCWKATQIIWRKRIEWMWREVCFIVASIKT